MCVCVANYFIRLCVCCVQHITVIIKSPDCRGVASPLSAAAVGCQQRRTHTHTHTFNNQIELFIG